MSKLKALITTLVLGSSSVALADTSVTFHGYAQTDAPAATVRDHRAPWFRPAPVRGTWISLAQPMSGNANLRLDSQAKLNQIRIQSAVGSTYISTVTVRFADGSRQKVTLNKAVDPRNPMVQFALDKPGRVDRISIKGSTRSNVGSYQVFGYGTAAATRPTRPVPPVYQPPVYQAPIALSSAISFANTDGYRSIDVNQATRFQTLRLEGLNGQTFVSKIQVTFANGQTQSSGALNRTLLAGQTLDLALTGGAAISRLIVFTNDTLTPVPYHATGSLKISAL